jgi:segregation and condensation protein A
MINTISSSYKLTLENYFGPLDLLLYLVREDEINSTTIPIIKIAEQYIRFLETLSTHKIEIASEFLVMTSTLLLLKSRALLPPQETGQEEDQERYLLIQSLLQYRKIKEKAKQIEKNIELQSKRFPRGYTTTITNNDDSFILDSWELLKAFSELTSQIKLAVPLNIICKDISIEELVDNIMSMLNAQGKISFSQIARSSDKITTVGYLLAVLELAKTKIISLVQNENFSEIEIVKTGETKESDL